MTYIERDFKEAYIRMKERALDALAALGEAETALRRIDVLCHIPSNGQHAYTHFQRDFDAIRKLTAPYRRTPQESEQ